MNYYDDVMKEIRQAIEDGDIKKGLSMIDDELSLPYIPKDHEEALIELKARYMVKEASKKEFDDEEIEEYLFSHDPLKELAVVDHLRRYDLTQYIDLIERYLKSIGDKNAKALLVETLIEKGIEHEFTYLKDGIEYDFIPLYAEPISMSDGYKIALAHIDEALYKEPSLKEMAHRLLAKVAFEMLPLSFDEDEAMVFARSIIIYLYELVGDEEAIIRYRGLYSGYSELERSELLKIIDS